MKRGVFSLILLLLSLSAAGCGESGGGVDAENSADLCDDGVDNDGDGAADCDDAECAAFCVDTETGPPLAWRTTWVSAQQITEQTNLPPSPGLAENTLRQVIQISIGGEALRFRFSNVFSGDPLTIVAAGAARSTGGSAIKEDTHVDLTFDGEPSVTIEPGDEATSDPVDWEVAPRATLAISMLFDEAPPETVTGHPGARSTSYLAAGDEVASRTVVGSMTPHWYYLSGVDVKTSADAQAVVILGDSITDGRGSTTDGNDRWPDDLSRRLLDNPGTENIAVLNQGIGGNCLTSFCLGPSGQTRFNRDVLDPLEVTWLIVLEGVNDIGTNSSATAERVINGLTDVAERARENGITVFGGTIMPCEGFQYYNEDFEAKRQDINAWIRTTDLFDGVIDFDEITRDPDAPTMLSADIGSADGIHPAAEGYQIMADAIDLAIFETP